MDGLDISAIDQIDQDAFDNSLSDSDECEDLPMPDCIGIDSAVQDDDMKRLQSEMERTNSRGRTRTEIERDLELKILKPDSIRRQILENSMNLKNSNHDKPEISHSGSSTTTRSHVMNVIEKAGMSGIDKERINRIIHEASKGSLFYKRQAQRQEEIHKSIEKMLNRVKAATPAQIEKARVTCDRLAEELEKQRVFNRIIVHFDLDMFFAAVEIRDNPALRDKPVAVGGDSMVSTSNYIARRYGVRAAMPGFIAKKLCPDLIIIKPRGFKYREASSEVFGILEQYDPELTGMSLDEAYLDLTEYVKNTLERDGLEFEEYYDGTLPKIWWSRASEIVEEIRKNIFEKTQLTCSAGIACNTLLSKISTDINKPDGQFMVQGYPADVNDFISKTPVEKVSGIGKVSAQFLNALEIKTCGDILSRRHFLPLVFYEINVRFYLRVAFGDGSTSIKTDDQRKSKSVERTFSAIKDTLILLDKLDSICEELCTKYLKPYRIRGRTVTVKLKRNTFMTTTKSYSMLVATNDKLVIYSAAKNLLLSEIANEPPEISYRLLGVKLSNLADDGVATNQLTIDAMLRNQEMGKPTKSGETVHRVVGSGETMIEGSNSNSDLISIDDNSSSSSVLKADQIAEQNLSSTEQGIKTEPESSLTKKVPKNSIESFFSKKMKSNPKNHDIKERSSGLDTISQADDDEFFDAQSSGGDNSGCDLNQMAQREQSQNEPNNDDFQCPYCFKPFSYFEQLQKHVDCCNMKIPIDVNRSFFTQRTNTGQSPTGFFSQQKSRATSSQTPIIGKSARLKRQPKQKNSSLISRQKNSTSPDIDLLMNRSSLSTQGNQSQEDGKNLRESGRKISYYERFIESNSQSLKKSVRIEPLQCPYCAHGFLNFTSLESHVVMCTKKRSAS